MVVPSLSVCAVTAVFLTRMRLPKDVDIMGVKRGAHMEGEEICKRFIFKIPGGTKPDGSVVRLAPHPARSSLHNSTPVTTALGLERCDGCILCDLRTA